jgi:hypothetical protein
VARWRRTPDIWRTSRGSASQQHACMNMSVLAFNTPLLQTLVVPSITSTPGRCAHWVTSAAEGW